jgi:hypothetical protein
MVVSTFPKVPTNYDANRSNEVERINEFTHSQNSNNLKNRRKKSGEKNRLTKPKPRGVPQPPKKALNVKDKAFRIIYLEENTKKNPLIPEDFVSPVERSRKCKSIGGGPRLPSLELLQQDKKRSVWTNYVGAKKGEPKWKNDTNGCKMFLASQYRVTGPVTYSDPSTYNTQLLPQQFNPAKEMDPNSIHPPDLVDPRTALSLTQQEFRRQKARLKGKKPKQIIPAWDNSPQNVVEHLLWRQSESLK